MKTQIHKLFLVSALTAGLVLWLPRQATAQSFTVLKNFTGAAGTAPGAAPIANLTLSGNTLYGGTTAGGVYNSGTLFKMNLDGSGFTLLKNLPNFGGGIANAGLTLSGSTIYGITQVGGSFSVGTVFKMNTDGSGYTVLHSFGNGSDGAYPYASLTLSGSTLYGTTTAGGTAGYGMVFKMNIDGSGYTQLHSFTRNSDGAYPSAGLTLSGSTLYGTTAGDGSTTGGTVFKMNTDGSGYAVLYNFQGGSDSYASHAVLTLVGSTLYGTAIAGGISDNGTVFKINTDGTGYSIIHRFNGSSDGGNPFASLTLAGNALYGTAANGGSYGYGTVFKVNTDGSGYAVLKNFNRSADGAYPNASLTLSGSTLYGTAQSGGSSNFGTLFKVSYSVAAKNTLVPTAPAGAVYSMFGTPACNDFNQVAFKATLLSGFGDVMVSNSTAIYVGNPGAEALAVRTSDLAPNATGAATTAYFSGFSDPVINSFGEIAFRGTLKILGSVTALNDTGLWSTVGGTLHLVAREGDVDPDTGGTFSVFNSFALPDYGDIVFQASLLIAGGINANNNSGLWTYNATGAPHKLIRTSDTALVGGTTKTINKITFLPTVPYSPGQTRSMSASGDTLIYNATFTDGTTAILTADHP
ncbi:MAG: hypothetical protein RLZZ350_1347 [Verrucomicrobiota bacterium]|jgi:uncharacterized repeat protein (TIGR03803 family)